MGPIAVSARAHSGMREVQTPYGRHAFVALTAAIDFHLLAVAAYFLIALLSGRVQSVTVPGAVFIVIPPGPGIPKPPSFRPQGDKVPPGKTQLPIIAAITIPLPVMIEDSEIVSDAGKQISPAADPVDGAGVSGNASPGGYQNEPAGASNPDADQGEPILKFVDVAPVPIKIVKPEYPDDARRMALEGVVWVKALVEKDGRVTKATVLKSSNDMFNDRSVQAALRWVFVPGMMTYGPVRVWTSIPFRFKLEK